MIKIKKDKIIADGLEKDIENINVMSLSRNYLSFSNRIADCVKYEKDINVFYGDLIKSGLSGFILVGNNIINLNNIDSISYEFYQYAGISIHESSKENAELCLLVLTCKNGKKESIPFRTFKEAEECYQEINTELIKLNNNELSCN